MRVRLKNRPTHVHKLLRVSPKMSVSAERGLGLPDRDYGGRLASAGTHSSRPDH